jgi:hypothetical protein
MKNSWLLALLAFVVAGVSLFLLWLLLASYVMRSMPAVVETVGVVALLIAAVGFIAALFFAWRMGGGWPYRAALAVMLLAGLGPLVFDWQYTKIATARAVAKEAAERQALEAKFLSQFDTYKKEVAERIASKQPFTPLEAQKFLDFVQGSDLSRRSLKDYSPEAFALFKQALDARVFDPNARVKGPRTVDVAEEPLFVGYYKFYLQSGMTLKRVHEREWRLWQMMIAGGANLDDPAAAVLRDDVKRETGPYELKGYLAIK